MGSLSPIHWVIFIGVAALLFGGRGKLSSIMGDAAKGVRAFKDGLKGEDEHPAAPPVQIVAPPLRSTPTTAQTATPAAAPLDRQDIRP